jgi:hypothetical protein
MQCTVHCPYVDTSMNHHTPTETIGTSLSNNEVHKTRIAEAVENLTAVAKTQLREEAAKKTFRCQGSYATRFLKGDIENFRRQVIVTDIDVRASYVLVVVVADADVVPGTAVVKTIGCEPSTV